MGFQYKIISRLSEAWSSQVYVHGLYGFVCNQSIDSIMYYIFQFWNVYKTLKRFGEVYQKLSSFINLDTLYFRPEQISGCITQ